MLVLLLHLLLRVELEPRLLAAGRLGRQRFLAVHTVDLVSRDGLLLVSGPVVLLLVTGSFMVRLLGLRVKIEVVAHIRVLVFGELLLQTNQLRARLLVALEQIQNDPR